MAHQYNVRSPPIAMSLLIASDQELYLEGELQRDYDRSERSHLGEQVRSQLGSRQQQQQPCGEDATLEEVCLSKLFAMLTDGSLSDLDSAAVALSSIDGLPLKGRHGDTFARLKRSFVSCLSGLEDNKVYISIQNASNAPLLVPQYEEVLLGLPPGALRDTTVAARAESKAQLRRFLHLKKGGQPVARRSIADLQIAGLVDGALLETYPLEALLAGVVWPQNVDPAK